METFIVSMKMHEPFLSETSFDFTVYSEIRHARELKKALLDGRFDVAIRQKKEVEIND